MMKTGSMIMKTFLCMSVVGLMIWMSFSAMATWSAPTCIAGQKYDSSGGGSPNHGLDPNSEGEGPDGFRRAIHPQNDAFSDDDTTYVAIVYCAESGYTYQSRNVWNIRLAYSEDNGQTWSFEWVRSDMYNDQDYPDVHFVYDTVDDMLKLIVVWQEKARDGSTPYAIKAREKILGDRWEPVGASYSVSPDNDDNDNIYPKIATCSANSITYWNVIWQDDSYIPSNDWDVTYRTFIRDQSSEEWMNPYTFMEMGDMQSPSIDCIHLGSDENVYIIFEFYLNNEVYNGDSIEYISQTVDSDGYITSNNGDRLALNSNNVLGYPDISAIDPPNEEIIVDCVWMNGTSVNYTSGTNGGTSFDLPICLAGSMYSGLRSVAIDMVFYDSDPDIYQVSVVYTDNFEVWLDKRLSNNGNWNPTFESQPSCPSLTNDYNYDFVDVSVKMNPDDSYIYSHITWQYKYLTIPYSVWYINEH